MRCIRSLCNREIWKQDARNENITRKQHQQGNGNTQPGIEQRERQATQQAQLGITQPQVRLDGHSQDADDLAIDEIEGVNQYQAEQHPGAISTLVNISFNWFG